MINMAEENLESVQETTETFDVIYSCLRCGTNVSNTELSRLPE
ncbi:MAG: RNA polymerase Rbp10, partial [Nitrosarchaeum sp.]|nr:RNA polymerase Rbp10 [Nitrosarchaeum sp.]